MLSQPFFTFPSCLGITLFIQGTRKARDDSILASYNDQPQQSTGYPSVRPLESQLLDYSRFDAAKIAFKLFAIILSIVFRRRLPFKLPIIFILNDEVQKVECAKEILMASLCLTTCIVLNERRDVKNIYSSARE